MHVEHMLQVKHISHSKYRFSINILITNINVLKYYMTKIKYLI